MVKATLIARVIDGLPLVEGLDTEKEAGLDVYKQQAKQLCKQMSNQSMSASRMSVESGPYVFHYLVERGVVFLTVCDKQYPKRLAFGFLEELQREFDKQFGDQTETAARPYAFVKFDTVIQRTKRQYADARAQRNLDRLQAELSEVHSIMTRNISDVLGQGERLERVSAMSSNLALESKRYAKKAQALSRQALMKKYVPLAAVGGVVFLTLFIRWCVVSLCPASPAFACAPSLLTPRARSPDAGTSTERASGASLSPARAPLRRARPCIMQPTNVLSRGVGRRWGRVAALYCAGASAGASAGAAAGSASFAPPPSASGLKSAPLRSTMVPS